jgi:hypothetical protein
MARLKEDSLQFARAHIETFYDSDFFPKADEFDALWLYWDQVRHVLTQTNVEKLALRTPRALPAPKSCGGYRIVHQLDPLDALVYTALVHDIARDVEAARLPVDQESVFSYRIELSENSFFSRGNGYENFIRRCRSLAAQRAWVLVTDVADFYNSIYLHRLHGAICFANPTKEGVAHALEDFLGRLNGKASQGVPVGPAASIVMSEATLSDLDQYLVSKDADFVRYVDDIRVFSDSEEYLLKLKESLTEYLFESHRLQLNWQKTQVLPCSDLVEKYLDAPALIEMRQLLGAVRTICDYGDQYTADDVPQLRERFLATDPSTDDRVAAATAAHQNRIDGILRIIAKTDADEKREVRSQAFASVFLHGATSSPLDIGLVRHALRQCRAFRNPVLLPIIFENFDSLGPVVPDTFLYLNAVTDSTLADAHLDQFRRMLDSRLIRTSKLARFWAYWYLASHPEFVRDRVLGQRIWNEAYIEHQARAARTTRNLAWIRSEKTAIGNYGPWQRRALLLTTEVMPRDERKAWLKSLSLGMDIQEESIVQWANAR